MDELMLSGYQALQLLALGPCLFMLFFLCAAGRDLRKILVPALYFLALACNFLLPLTEAFGFGDRLDAALMLGASAAPAMSFLFIVQFLSDRLPQPLYWFILAVPLIGGGPLVYAVHMTQGEVCLYDQLCTEPENFRRLYDIFSTSLTCLLTLFIYRRLTSAALMNAVIRRRQKYAIVLALLMLNLALLVIDLLQITQRADMDHARLAETIVYIGFIYLALTSLFRVFDHSVEIAYERLPSIGPKGPSPQDEQMADRLRAMFATEKLHRDMELDRAKLARKLGVSESVLSRVVNQCFEENVSMLVNRYRVEEAKERLSQESTPITVIAFEVGFSSIPSFNRVFRQLCEMAPSEYRQMKGKRG